ncbi:hypothetical protein N1851_030389 [Merluccius polli]|uniref:Uncharacterized protein n=1 Tax=Merluccius polli TaxID=89951 RepID=A0AA47M5M3_MERPO|nr:hypothetical protein N1851_030389 [Merluccius polli]
MFRAVFGNRRDGRGKRGEKKAKVDSAGSGKQRKLTKGVSISLPSSPLLPRQDYLLPSPSPSPAWVPSPGVRRRRRRRKQEVLDGPYEELVSASRRPTDCYREMILNGLVRGLYRPPLRLRAGDPANGGEAP